jgi:predicted dehydrogenase
MDSRRNFIGTFAGGIAGTLASPASVLGANDRVRFGVIGAGSRGMQLLREALACPNTECVSVADVYQSRLEQAGRTVPGVQAGTAYEDVLGSPQVDAVIIATPQHLHAEHFTAAIHAGKHVYLEKAVALSLEDAIEMRSVRESSPRTVVQVGHQFCSSGMFADASRFLESGWVGRITGIEANHYRNTPREKPMGRRPVQPDITAERVDWQRFLGHTSHTDFDPERFLNWRLYWDYSGGSIHDSMSQQIAFWYKLLDASIPKSVTATGAIRLWDDGREVPDTLGVSMEHHEGFYISWRSNFGNSRLGTGEYLLGTDGTIQRSQQIRYYPEKVNRPGGLETLGSTRTEQRAHMQNFLDAVRSRAQVNCPFETGYRVSVACAMAVESYRQGRSVRWDGDRERIT